MSERKCELPAQFRYTWPGQKEEYCCVDHADQLKKVSDAIGMNLQFINLYGPLGLKESKTENIFCTSII